MMGLDADEFWDKLHSGHVCESGRCECRCGCQVLIGCKTILGPLCSHCMLRETRGDDEHGAREEDIGPCTAP